MVVGQLELEGLPGTENSDAKAEMRKSNLKILKKFKKKFKNCATGVTRGKNDAGSGERLTQSNRRSSH